VILPGAPASAATPGIALAKQAPAKVLAGASVAFTLTASNPASNPAAVPEYNVSFRDVLPIGLSYQAGSTSPSDLGDPTVITDGVTGQQTLLWPDAFDLQVAASSAISFATTANAGALPVGSTILNTANAYASTAPRVVPKFTATGQPIANAKVQSATSNQTSTAVTALAISKTEPSPEAKLLRGIHDHPTVYTLTVTNTTRAASNAVSVTDYLPASEEFLGCGQVDNSSGVEYPGAPSLIGTPPVTGCPTPASVDTVANPGPDGTVSYPAGIYTKVVWNLGTLAAGQSVTINYAAGIPLRQNVLFSGGPTPASLGQIANLDNNTGASTRQLGPAASLVNYAHAAGSYTGPVAGGGTAVVADTTHTVTINDLRIYKSVSPSEFVAGAISTYTLHVDSGEYTDNSAITVTDVLPNGICPLDDVSNHVTGAPAECAPSAGFAPSLPYQSVTQNADGTFIVVFQPIVVAKDGSTVITYQGRDRTSYTGGALAGEPIAAGDSFTNSASETGTSTPVAATGFSGSQSVTDSTSATQTTSFGTLSKTVAARATTMDCSTASYGTSNPTFAKGDRACFQLTVPFSSTNQTRNAVLTDFLPDNTSYEVGSVSYPAGNTVDPAQISFDSSGAASGALSWSIGATTGDGSTQVPVGKVFMARFSVLILDAAAGPPPDKPGNIVKLRSTNSAGVARSLRDLVNFQIAAAPPIGLTKGVASVNGSTPVNPANTDHVTVHEGDAVTFRVDASNQGSVANANNVDVSNLQLWDVLPAGIRCAQVSAISDSGNCTNPGDAGQPSFTNNGTLSAIVWTGASVPALAAGAAKTYNYTVTIPAGVSVSTDLSNTAAVRSYTVANDLGGTSTYYPAANIDTTVSAGQYDAPAAADNSDVLLPDVTVTKGVSSAVNETGNVGAEASPAASTQATIGEQVTYTTSATIPAHTSVFNASFTDPLPTGLSLVSATGSYRPDAGSASTAALPAGVSFSAVAPPTFSWPASYDNTSATDQVFTMTIVAQVSTLAGNLNGVTRTNTASFASQTAATGGTSLPNRTASAGVGIVEPGISLTKTNNSGGPVSGGQTITYTLKPANAAGRPALHDAWQLDCLPAGMTFASYGSLPGGVSTSAPVAGDGSNGCPANYTVLAWNLGDLAGGSTLTLTYTATVDPTASGKTSLVNVAAVSGNSLAGARTSPVDPGNPAGRQYSTAANSTITIAGATATKSVSPTSATVGDTVNYTTSALLPAGVNFYNLSLIDQLPNGIDPNSVVLGTVSCTYADSTACTPSTASALTSSPGSGSSTVIGWLLGDATTAAQSRTVTVHYTAKVANVAAAVAGAALTNQLHVAWDQTAGSPPTSAGASYDQVSPTVTATVTVLEPSLSISKSVNKLHPEPGQTFGYTLTVSNANTISTSTGYNVTVTDTVPTGVVVDPASISGGGTISGANPSTGGGTISWTLPSPISKGTSAPVLTYSATLAPSNTLTAAGLTNTARVTGYDSLPAGGRHYTGGSSTATVSPFFPKLTTTKTTPGGTTAYIGESFGWQITARDTGSGAAYLVGTTDTLPANWTYDAGSAQVSVNGGPVSQIDPTTSTSAGVQTLTWTGLGNLPAGTALTITFTATPQPGVTGAPGVGIAVNQTNSASSTGQDLTGATGNASGPYSNGPGTATAHIGSADLTLTKAVGTAPVAGQSASWLLTVHNSGPDTASGPFTVTDPFNNPAPAGVTGISASGTGWSCTSAAPLSCSRTNPADTLANGASFPTITVSYNVDSTVTAGTILTNSATVGAHTHDPNPANNTGTANATVTAKADLAISKTLSSPQLIAGGQASYSLSVGNTGPSAAAGPITVSDPLPAGASFVSAGGTGWTCDPIPAGTVGATLHCTLPGPLAVGATPAAIVLTVGIPSGQTSAVSNTATVSSPTTDPVPANNSSTVTSTPVVRADLQLQKRHLTASFVAGQDAVYQIDVFNAGESDATGVSVSDPLPAGLSYQSFSSTDPNWNCTAAGATVSCGYTGSLTAGSTSSFTVTVHLASDFAGPAINTATVSASTTDPVPGNNASTDNSSVASSADLSIVKSHSGTATAGAALNFQLAVHNGGPSDVAGPVTVSDPLPAGLTFGSATGTGWSCGYTSGSRLVSCTLAAGLANGADASPITLATTVDSDAGPGIISNTADVSSSTADSVLSNNSSTDSVTVITSAAISLTKLLSSTPPVLAGTDASFTLVASNAGPSDADSVTVTDTLPANLSFDSYTGTGWSCTPSGQDVVCSRAGIPAGTSAPAITLNALVSASTPVTLPAGTTVLVNNASIDSATPGSKTNPAPVDVPVQAQANLSLTKTPKTGTVAAGGTYTWNLAVHNDGPSDAASPLTVTDTLPGYQTFLSADPAWNCTASAAPSPPSPTTHQTVTCTLAQLLAAGADAPVLHLLVQVDSSAPAGDETNTGTASSPTPGSSGSDSGTVTVSRTALLSISKAHSGNGVVGADLPFTLRVHNAGPSAADQIVVTDPLPAGLSFVSAAGAGWTCSNTAGTVSCALAGNLAVGGDSSDLVITATVGAAGYPSVTNSATVSSTDTDLPGTASASDQVIVQPSATLGLTKQHVGTFVVGQTGDYRLTVSNSGPTSTPGPVSIVDVLPAGLSYQSASGTGWTCSATGATVHCDLPGPLAAGGSSQLVITVNVLAAGYPSVTNSATAAAPGSPDATGTDTAPVTPLAVLSISKQLVSYKNNLATYQLTVHNAGPNHTVQPITVTDKLPAGLVFKSAGGTGWSCGTSGGTVTCLHPTSLAAGASSGFTLVTVVTAAPGTSISNTATVSGGAPSGQSSASQSAVLAVTATGGGPGTGSGAGSGSGSGLPQTGRNTEAPAGFALGLLLAGLGLLLLARRPQAG
jgi:uncharacterized repeat protein (TIGR01451 family)/fimbrial isopeptide formation D2 family protein/LPXTG-motif cell wall-anchored protein